jgi:hypothetical protein
MALRACRGRPARTVPTVPTVTDGEVLAGDVVTDTTDCPAGKVVLGGGEREIFTVDHAAKVAQAGGMSCEAKAEQEIAVPEETIEVQGLLVNGSGATARVKEQTGRVSTLVFVKSGGDWRIDGIR